VFEFINNFVLDLFCNFVSLPCHSLFLNDKHLETVCKERGTFHFFDHILLDTSVFGVMAVGCNEYVIGILLNLFF
jgi:hypothetical protein